MNIKPVKTRPLKDRIVEAAYELFNEHGIQHVTVDGIAAHAGTTKMGVYRHFASKDALVEDWLTDTIARYQQALDAIEREHRGDPRAQLMGWADHIASGLHQISHRGCPFANTIAEIPDRKNPLRLKIEQHKAAQATRITAMCRKADLNPADVVAAEITFLLEGAQVSVQNRSIKHIEKHVGTIMRRILEAASQRTNET